MKFVIKNKADNSLFYSFVKAQWVTFSDATRLSEEDKKFLEDSEELVHVNLLDFADIVPVESKTINYGIFGTGKVVRDEDGFIEIPVIIQESGLFVGSPPPELRIHEMGVIEEDEFNRQYVAKLNKRADLPFLLGKALVRVIPGSQRLYTEESNLKDGIEPLSD